MQSIHEIFSSEDSEDVIKSKIRAIGEEIFVAGGMDALRGCFYMFVLAYRFITKDKTSNKLKRQYQANICLLEKYLDGVGDWKA